MNKNYSLQRLCSAALLIALGIVIPMFMPIKFVLEPASFTLASHVAVFIAMMISPGVAISVALGTTLGFLLGGFPIVIVFRAASHVVFALLGALYLQKKPAILGDPARVRIFSLIIGLIHAVCEVLVVSVFYFGGGMSSGYYQSGFLWSVMLMVGLGTVIHSMVDFEIALVIFKALSKQRGFSFLLKR